MILNFKKFCFLLLMSFLLVGCGKTINKPNNDVNSTDVKNTEDKLKDPVLKWCQVYNPNGFNTITCVLSNPNDVDIDVSYDLVYYKDGEEVARSEYYTNFQVSPKHDDVIWGNVGIPSPSKVDEVKMENITVTPASRDSIEADIKYLESVDGSMYFSVKHKEDIEINYITFFLYNDINKNKKCDEGELVVTSSDSVLDKEGKVSFDIEGYEYTDYEIFYNAS